MTRGGWVTVVGVVVGLAAGLPARGQVTRVATFENFAEGQGWKPSFTDPASGITFRNSTNPLGGFSIDYSSSYFGGSTYLTAAGYDPGPGGGLGAYFGLTADLPALANRVGLDVTYLGRTAEVLLQGFDAHGVAVTPAVNEVSASSPFHLEATSAQYDIATFRVSVGTGFAGYDNVSYTVLPEPAVAGVIYLAVPLLIAGQRRRLRGKCI